MVQAALSIAVAGRDVRVSAHDLSRSLNGSNLKFSRSLGRHQSGSASSKAKALTPMGGRA